MEARVINDTDKMRFQAGKRPNLAPRRGLTPPSAPSGHDRMVIVHPSRLFRDCLKQAVGALSDCEIHDFATLDDALGQDFGNNLRLIIVGLKSADIAEERPRLMRVMEHARCASDEHARCASDEHARCASDEHARCASDEHTRFAREAVHVVATGDSEDPYFVVKLLKMGVRGYIPASLDLDVTLQALDLILAGGQFAPAGCLIAMSEQARDESEATAGDLAGLTRKQMAVMESIRQGKANKTIAYELNMCESTVKVHVRNIMKKLGAKNRTHVAYIANNLIAKAARI